MGSSMGDKSQISVNFHKKDPMRSAPDQMYQPDFSETEKPFPGYGASLPSDQIFIPYDERAIGGSGKYDLGNLPNGLEIEDESEMFEEAA